VSRRARRPPGHLWDTRRVQCPEIQADLSSRSDGEQPTLDADLVAAHLSDCTECRRFAEGLRRLPGARLEGIDRPPSDLQQRVLEAIEPDRSSSSEATALRWVLAVVAFAQIVTALPSLFNTSSGLLAHASRHFAVFSIALGCAFLYTALRPRRVGALFPFVVALSIGLLVTACVDVVAGRTPLISESAHLLEIVGLVTLWLLTRIERPRPLPRDRSTRLRAVVEREPIGPDQ
jgi:predicted anti-sigma-YlaC factor YlaD